MLDSSVIESLAQIVGTPNLLTDPFDLDRYSADALTPFRAFGVEADLDRLADLVVRPGTTEEVSQIVLLAGQQCIPLIPYGGGTGVMGGTLPVCGGIIIDMGRMNRVLDVRPTDLTARVEAGVVLQDLVLSQLGFGNCLRKRLRLLPFFRSVDVGGWQPWDENGMWSGWKGKNETSWND